MAVNNLSIGVNVVNHKGVKGIIEEISSASVVLKLEDGTSKTVSKGILARWWKDDEITQAADEVAMTIDTEEAEAQDSQLQFAEVQTEIKEEVKEEMPQDIIEEGGHEDPIGEQGEPIIVEDEVREKKPKKEKTVKTEEELAQEKAEKERIKQERAEQRKAQAELNKKRMGEMKDWILQVITEKFPEVELKQNTNYVAVRYAKRVAMEVHSKGENCNLYILPQGDNFEESEVFKRRDGSKAWIVNQGYVVPVQQTDDVKEEILRILEASCKLIDEKEEARNQERLRKKAVKQAKMEKLKTEKDLKRQQAKKDKERLKEIMKAKKEEEKARAKEEKEAQNKITENDDEPVSSVAPQIEEEDEEVF